MPEGSGWKCTVMAGLPGFGSSKAWASRRARGPARSSRVHVLAAVRAHPLGLARRIRKDGVAVWEEEDYCRTPLVQERAAVLDNYFHDLRVEPDSCGRRGLEQDRRIASPLTGLLGHAFQLLIPTAVLLAAPDIVVIASLMAWLTITGSRSRAWRLAAWHGWKRLRPLVIGVLRFLDLRSEPKVLKYGFRGTHVASRMRSTSSSKPDNAIFVKANFSENPWFPSVLEDERQLDRERYPDRYSHIWEGDYARAFGGAHFA
jgi:hypothetical protein